ncbi:lysophosphatidic acid phosphatase type 6-like [Asterias rubens]|uniref:lysophosphatidic acid phosphatase type 6-like n=1 Tax=Asterias rubens TaxID=7604 RepID=UPI00145563BF|nr:lysophosphatidic acid phosphatase type 6-like [Asterias rubens]
MQGNDRKHLPRNGCFLSSDIREESMETLDQPGMQLKLVLIFFRHGARTPIRITPGIEEANWDKEMCVEEDHHKVEYDIFSLDGKSGPHHSPIEQSYQANAFKGGATRGQLTVLGMNQSYELGTYFKKHYIEKCNFLSPEFSSNELFMRSTNINRNIKSLSCVLGGLYGDSLSTKQNESPRIHVDHSSTEILYPNYQHSKPLMDNFFKTVKNTDVVPGVRHVRLQIQELLEQNEDVHLDLVSVRDGISARKVHDVPLSAVLEPLASVIEKAAVGITCHSLGKGTDTLQYAIGPLLQLILSNIERVTSKTCEDKMHLYAVHDTTLIPLLIAVGIFEDAWPGFCSDVIIETYQDQNGDCFIRILYLGKEKKLGPNNNTLLPMQEFKDLLSPCLINKEEFEKSLINVETF